MKEKETIHSLNQIEMFSFIVPIEYYITEQELQYTHNGIPIIFTVNGNMPNGYKISIGVNGKPLTKNDYQIPMFYLEVSMDSSNGMFQRDTNNPSTLVQTLQYPIHKQNQITSYEMHFPDGSKQQVYIHLINGNCISIPFKGLKKSNGTRGDFHLVIELIDK